MRSGAQLASAHSGASSVSFSASCTSTAPADEPEQIAEILWGSIHRLVMLELVGINALMSGPVARFERAIDFLFRGLSNG